MAYYGSEELFESHAADDLESSIVIPPQNFAGVRSKSKSGTPTTSSKGLRPRAILSDSNSSGEKRTAALLKRAVLH